MLDTITKAILAPFLLVSSLIIGQPAEPPTQFDNLGAVQTVAGKNYFLSGGGVGSSDTSITLTKFQTPVSNYDLAMADFGEIGYLTLEPGSATRQEIVSFTGITQNSDDTATLTGVTRGLSVISPYTASTTLQKAHPGGSVVVISNPPQLYETFANLNNAETIDAVWTFDADRPPILDETGKTASSSDQLVSKEYVDNVTNQGAATSTESVGGIVELATQIEVASSTATTADKPLVLQAQNATSTPQAACDSSSNAGALCVVVGENDGKLNQGWLDLTEDITF